MEASMNEKMLAERFSADLDRLLANESVTESADVPGDYRDALEVAKLLRRMEFSDTRQQHQLRQTLLEHPRFTDSQQNNHQPTSKGGFSMDNLLRQRNPLWIAPVMTMILLLALTLAPVRAFAQELLHQIGAITLTRETTETERFLSEPEAPPLAAQPTAVPGGSGPSWQGRAYESPYVPAGYELDAATPNLAYVNGAASHGGYSYFRIYSLASSLEEFPISGATISSVAVRQTTGSFVEGAPLYVKPPEGRATRDQLEIDPVNLLMWEENGKVIVVESNHVPLDEMLKIAEAVEID
jgi:hypothetical protein